MPTYNCNRGSLYLNLPSSEQAELVVDATLYLNGNGTGSPNSGTGFAAAVGYRYGFIAPYVAYDFFGLRRVFTNSLANPSFKSLLVQWIMYL